MKVVKRSFSDIETIKSIPGRSPQRPIVIHQQPIDDVVAQRRRIILVVPVVLPLAAFWIEPEEPIVGRPDPDESGTIFNEADDIERNTRLYTYEDGAFSRRIDAVKRKPCSDPEISVTVFVKTADAIFFQLSRLTG